MNTSETPIGGCLKRRFPRRPGPGWKEYEAVWEHASGIRVHSLGCCRLADGSIINGEHWPECLNLWEAIREQGNTRRRGLMVWALAIPSNVPAHAQREEPRT
jgi:hypothetical protein